MGREGHQAELQLPDLGSISEAAGVWGFFNAGNQRDGQKEKQRS